MHLKIRRSSGVPVTPAVHRLLVDANRARDGRDWSAAAAGYSAALDRAPDLAHIWIQYGHASKELGQTSRADGAYRKAAALDPNSAEPHLHLGHLNKVRGDVAAAARCYLRAVELDPSQADAACELHALAARGMAIEPDTLVGLLQQLEPLHALNTDGGADPAGLLNEGVSQTEGRPPGRTALHLVEAGDGDRAPQPDTASLVFDISDLVSYFRNARLPTGIQRVQIEVISSALHSENRANVRICAFVENRDEWLEIPAATFLALASLSLESGDRTSRDWLVALTRLHLYLATGTPIIFPEGAFLINLGTSWWLQNYFLFVRKAKATRHIHYVPFVHDFIPVMASEHCTKELTQDFITWAVGVFDHADFFLVNSEATKRDLLFVAEALGHEVDSDRVAVVRLDADFRKPSTSPTPESKLARWGLQRAPFVLFVSTIESRKNHLAAFDAWIALIRKHGLRNTPKLVCVGNRGWMNDTVYAQLEAHEGLRDRVVMLSGLSDADLALLYRSCRFTLYPSRYEGWGLPITESLCYGKAPLVSDSSSLPEAGGPFAVYFESGSAPRLVEALETLIYDDDFLRAREQMIADEFLPRPWSDIAQQMADEARHWIELHKPQQAAVPLARLGAYHPIVRNFETRIWRGMRSAEIFRAGSGWWGPDGWGCWTKPEGGRLQIGVCPEEGPLRLFLRLHCPPGVPCPYEISVDGLGLVAEGVLEAHAFKWVAIDIPADVTDGVLGVDIEGLSSINVAPFSSDGADDRVVSIGVAGFYLCRAEDTVARATFLEALAMDNLADLAFARETPAGKASRSPKPWPPT